MSIERQSIFVLSSLHLTPETLQTLAVNPPQSLLVAAYPDGFFIYVSEASELCDDVPTDLREIAKWLDTNFADERWVRFEEGSSFVEEGLPVYEHAVTTYEAVEQKKMCVISTAHLKPQTREEWLSNPPESFSVASFEHGFYVYVKATDLLDEEDYVEIREVAKWLDTNRYGERWVMFDCDASAVDGLTVYDDDYEEVDSE